MDDAKILEQGTVLLSFQWELQFIFYSVKDDLSCLLELNS